MSVGHHIERKGHHLTFEALKDLPDCVLLLAGDGPMEKRLRSLAHEIGVADRVRFLGAIGHRELPDFYSAADATVLASSREGWANVLLESMACGTPVVATGIWGTPEIVRSPDAGVLVERTPASIQEGIKQLRENLPARDRTRAYAEQFSWDETSAGVFELFQRVVSG